MSLKSIKKKNQKIIKNYKIFFFFSIFIKRANFDKNLNLNLILIYL